MNCDGGNCSARSGDDRQLRTGRNVARRIDVLHRRVISVVDDQAAQLITLASKLRTEVVGGVLADREVEALAVESHSSFQLDSRDFAILRDNRLDRCFQYGYVQRLELVEQSLAHIRLLAVRADNDLPGPRRERERHSHSLPPSADDDGLLVPRLVTIAVRAHVNGLAVTALEPWNVGPEILDADCEENSIGFDRRSVAKADGEQLTRLIDRRVHDTAHELDIVCDALRVT